MMDARPMPENVQVCPLCGCAESVQFDRRIFHQREVTNRICKGCGLVYQSPRMSAAELDGFYRAEYRRLYQGKEDPIQKDLIVQRKRAEATLTFARKHIPGVSHHLDIGCSTGLFLQHFQLAYSCQPYGVEPGVAYRQYAQKSGLAVVAALDELPGELRRTFDLVSMMHVLEHIPDPVSYLAQIRENFLKPDGWLLLEVPNLYAHDSFETAHLLSFCAHTLAQTVQKAGFNILAIRKHGLPRSRIIPLYVTLIARSSGSDRKNLTGIVKPERGAAARRRLGMLYRGFTTRLFPGQAWLPIDETHS
jgi:2-polyprenyl-3-methyl-5-hydroxy-6-metoxy-1,4-benzoquinol methylase